MSARFAVARRIAGLAIVATAVFGMGCGDSIVGTATYGGEPCTLPATSIPAAAVEGLAPADVRVAVVDAAERMTAALSASSEADEIRTTLASLTSEVDAADVDTGCRVIHAANEALDALDDAPGARPDIAGLRLVVDLVTVALAGS